MNKFLGYIFSPIFYLCFGLLLVIFHPIQYIAYKLFGYSAHKRTVEILNFLLCYCNWIMGSSVNFKQAYKLPIGRPIIFVANHQSMYDIPPLIWFLKKYHAKFISKIELTKGIPSISFHLRVSGGANIDRGNRKQAISEITNLGKRMKANNWSSILFPEGTRSKTGILKPFQIGGITNLLKTVPNALVVPIAIQNSWKMVQYGKFPLSFGEKTSWTVLQPIEPGNMEAEEVIQLAENAIRGMLGQQKRD